MMDIEMRSDPVDELDSIGFRDIIEQDSRPTLVLDLDPDDLDAPSNTASLSPVFCNAALRSHIRLLDIIKGEILDDVSEDFQNQTYAEFRSWAVSVSKFDDSRDIFPLSLQFQNMLWTGSTVRKRWRLISGNLCFQASDLPSIDLSSGPPSEVATGGMRLEQSFKNSATDATLSRKRQHMQPQTSHNSSRDTAVNTSVSSDERQSIKSLGNRESSSHSSNNTGNTTSTRSIALSRPESGVPDWTVAKPEGSPSKHVLFARTIDWGATPLGRMENWSPDFRQLANLVMQNSHPAALFWGEELTMMYNEAYSEEVAGNKHPGLMGTGFQGPFSELWEAVGPIFKECARTGISARKENQYLPMERYGYLEETYFSWTFNPLYGGTSKILGFYNAPFETTQQVINHRRMQLINRLGERISLARTVKEFWRCVLEVLEEEHHDVPFALLYSVGDSEDNDTSSVSSGSTMSLKSCYFEGSIGLPEGHPATPQQLDLKRSREGFIPSFREAMRTREPTKLQTRDGTLPEVLLEGITWRGFGDPCREAIIFPLRPTNGDTILAFLLLGVNTRRSYDEEYRAFTSTLNRQLATSLASVMLFEDEIRRSRNAVEAAALQREQLSEQLALQTSRMRRMTELSPLGMYLYTPEGFLLEANDRYYEMTGMPRENAPEMSFMDHVVEASKPVMEQGWYKMTVLGMPWTDELQLKKTFVNPLDLNAEPIDYWVMATSQPQIDEDGQVRSIMGSITDISHLKWAQGLQNRRLLEAEETRRQQNEFIDITSHEMRNPLSAILQCADDISTSLQSNGVRPDAKVIENCIESADTIVLCVQHQKAIVDDILTVSKLDSNLVLITPSPTQPIMVVQRVMKMFGSELQAKNIQASLVTKIDFQELNVDWVTLDQSRLLQILINLMSNAIKFTFTAPKRVINVHIGASLSPPVVKTENFHYIPLRLPNVNSTQGEDWGTGEHLFLRFKVEDTGCGLNDDEKQVLFQRFSQASPRTHAIYGGSGLGLFISRQLAELHGGQIGVASEAGVGSVFGFYIKVRRAVPPAETKPRAPSTTEGEGAALNLTRTIQTRGSATPRADAILAGNIAGPKFDPKQLHILVVEDNLVNQRVLTRQLQKVGSTINVANNGIEALEYLEKTMFRKADGQELSLILMDLEMPEMDGLTCVREIRKMEAEGKILAKRVPIIAVTANVREEQIVAAKGSGMDDVVSKPFRIPELFAKIEILLNAMAGG